ncbi:hypothetical protein BVG19_g3357 [[Candida] boidinii]|nr:hypothetical protein BVG19_g3357 [[Candida] boidinii]OWB53226.1 hypothetical protein B5S27_g4819 [[Candida] boidinii]
MGNLQTYIDEYLKRTNSTEDSLPEFIKVPGIYPDYKNLQWDSSSASSLPSVQRPQPPPPLSTKIPNPSGINTSKDSEETSNSDMIDPTKISSGKYKLYFQSLNVRNSKINENDDSLNSRYYKSHKVYSPNFDLVKDTHRLRKELSTSKKTKQYENASQNIQQKQTIVDNSDVTLDTGFNYSKSTDESLKPNDTIEDPLTQFDNLISYPNIFSSNNIPPLFHHCSTSLLGYQFIFGGLTLLSYEEYEEYLRSITDDFTIPLENIEIRLAQDIIPLPIDRNIITSLAIKPNRTVYRYSTDSNTLLPVIDYESQAAAAAATASGYTTHSAASSSTSTTTTGPKHSYTKRNPSQSSNSVSSASTNSYRSVIPSQLVCATSSAASKRHAVVYGGFDIETEIIRHGNRVIIEKRFSISNNMRLFDGVSLKFRELNIIVHPSVSAKLPQAIPRFGHVQTGLTIEENNVDYLENLNKANLLLSTSNSNSNGKKTPLQQQQQQQQQENAQPMQPPPLTSFTSNDDVLSKYARPAIIFIGFGYKSTNTGKSFIALNDMWRCEICVNQALSKANVNKLEFSENVICYPVGSFDIQKNHFKYTYDSNGDLIDDPSDDDVDEFTGCYKSDEESNWPGGRAFCGCELIDNSTLYNTNVNNHSNFSGSDTNTRSIGSPLSDSAIASAQFQLKSQTQQPQDTTSASPKLHHPKPERLAAANISNNDQFASLSRNKSVNSSNTTSTQTKSTSPFYKGTQQKQYYSSLFSDTPSAKSKTVPLSSSPATLISQSSLQKPSSSQQHGYTSLLGATASPSSDISPFPISSPLNMAQILVNKEIFREKTLIIHGGSRIIHKRIKSKGAEGEYEIFSRHEIFGDLWWFNLSSETWTKISTFADKSLFNSSEYQYESDIQRVSSIRSFDTNEDFPRQMDRDLLDKQSYIPRNYSICGHNIILDGKHLIVIGGSFAINYSDETFQYITSCLNNTNISNDVYQKTLQNDGFQKSKDANITEFVLKNQIKHLSKNKIFNTAFQTLILNLKTQIWREGTFFNSVGKNNVYHEYFKRTVGSIAYKDKSKIVVFGGWLTGIHNKDLDRIINEIRDSRYKYTTPDDYDNTDISRIRSAASVISPHLQSYNDVESVATSRSSVFDVKENDENILRLELVSNLLVEVYIPLMIL